MLTQSILGRVTLNIRIEAKSEFVHIEYASRIYLVLHT